MSKKYIPPKSAQNAGKKVLKWEKEGKISRSKYMTPVGWKRAEQLASGKPISFDIVKRMAKFNRHRSNSKVNSKYKNTPYKDKGYVAWLAWGGDSGINWAIKTVEKEKNIAGVVGNMENQDWRHELDEDEKIQQMRDEDAYQKFLTYIGRNYKTYEPFFEEFLNSPQGKTIQYYIENKNKSPYYKEFGLVDIDILWKFREFDRRLDPKFQGDYTEELKSSFEEKGIYDAVLLLVDKEGRILLGEGNHRVTLGRELGIKFLPARVHRVKEVWSEVAIPKRIELPLTAFYEWEIQRGKIYNIKASGQPKEYGIPQIDDESLLRWLEYWTTRSKNDAVVSGIMEEEAEQLYFDAINKYYDSAELIDLIKQGEDMAKQMAGVDEITTEISDSGNMIIRYIMGDESIFLLGIVTVKGRLTKEDVMDYNDWADELLAYLDQGYKLLTSPNDLSMPLLDRIVKRAKKEKMKLNVQEMGSMDFGGMTWKNILIDTVSGFENNDYIIEITCY